MTDNLSEQMDNLSPEKHALLALRLKNKHKADSSKQVIPRVLRDDQNNVFPLSFAQQRLWFMDQLEPGNPYYNGAMAIRMEGTINKIALEQSFNEIAQRHESLRTVFTVAEDGQPMQKILPSLSIRVQAVDLRQYPASEQNAKAQDQCAAEARTPFDLTHGPLIRITLLQLNEIEHILLMVVHHIIADLWSVSIIFKELAVLYEAFCAEKHSPLAELPIQYVDFAIWQRSWLQGAILEKQLSYWKRQLDQAPRILELPTDRPRPPIQNFQGGYQSRLLPASLTQALKTLSRQSGTTLFMLLLAAFKTLLYRYTNQSDILVGTPVLGRNRLELEAAVGCFINTIVLRTQLDDQISFKELLGKVRQTSVEAYSHQDLPFELLVEELHLERSLSHNPLFQVMFTFQDASLSTPKMAGVTLNPFGFYTDMTKFDLVMFASEIGENFNIGMDYSAALFDPDTIAQLLEHFQVLLQGIIANPDQPLSALPLLTEAEQQRLLIEWNNTHVTYPDTATLPELFEAQAKRTPNSIALIFEEQHLTYQELNMRANQLAHYLRQQGVGPEVRVGVCLERSIELVVSLLGIFKAGGVYVPLDPSYPAERLAFMQADAQLAVLLTITRLAQTVPAGAARVLCLDAEAIALARQSNISLPQPLLQPENLAYIIYTSGSTGLPKGVMTSHRAICNQMHWRAAAYPLGVDDRWLQLASIGFEMSVWEFLIPLLAGAQLVLPEPGSEKDLLSIIRLITEQNITQLRMGPSLLNVFLDQPGVVGCQSLRRIFCGGETLPRNLQERSLATLSADLYNQYGPTETCAVATIWHCTPDDQHRQIPIGRPVTNSHIYVLDNRLQPVPVGVAGELYIGGLGVARGYLNRPDLTAEKFIPNPFGFEPGDRLYKTGDLVRYLSDGNIQFLGRVDHQIKIRGFRVEPGEIEVALARHSVIRECVVIAREDTSGDTLTGTGKRLVAYLVSQQKLDPAELRAFLKKQGLPEYTLPSVYVFLEGLPLTPNGKVDRKALPAPSGERPDLEHAYLPPRTLVEKALADIWAQVLRVEQVGINDNFFELGGDSILSIQIISKANQMGYALTAKQIFQYQTIAELAAVAQVATAIKAEQGLILGHGLLTPIQRQFFERNLASPHYYNQALFLEVTESLDFSLMGEAVQHLLQHHDALRQRFVPNDQGNWLSTYADLDESSTECLLIDLSASPLVEQNRSMEATASSMQTNLNLSTGPLMRVILFELGPHRPNRLLWICHHLLVDGISWRILLEDFQTIYTQLRLGQVVVLPAKTTSYKDWAKSLAAYARSTSFQAETPYWMEKHRVASLPVDLPKAPEKNIATSAQSVTISFSTSETQALLQEIPRAYGVQINDALLMALGYALTKWTGTETCLIDLEGHGREEIIEGVDLSRTVGWFTATFPLFLDLHGASDLRQTLRLVKKQLQNLPSRGIGYGLLRYLSADERVISSLRQLPQAEVSFNYLGQLDQALSADSLFRMTSELSDAVSSGAVSGGAVFGAHHERRQHLIDINGAVSNGQMRLEWTYSTSTHHQETIEQLAKHYKEALQWLINHKDSPETEKDLLTNQFDVDLSDDEFDNILNEIGFSSEAG